MKTVVTAVLAVVATAIAFSLLPGSRATTAPTGPVGRYLITSSSQEAFLLDTETGAVWQSNYGHQYCKSKTSPSLTRQIFVNDKCADTEYSMSGASSTAEFDRVSVQGLYQEPLSPIDAAPPLHRPIRP